MTQRSPVLAAALAVAGSASMAQTGPEGGWIFVTDFAQRLESVRNPDLDDDGGTRRNAAVTDLGFSLSSVTPTQSLTAAFATTFRAVEDEDPEFDERRASLDYARQGANSRIDLGIDYARDDIEFLDPLSLIVTPEGTILVPEDIEDLTGEGLRETLDMGFSVVTGIEGPFGLGLAVSRTELRYTDVTSTELEDSERTDAALTARFDIGAGRALTAGLTYSLFDEEDAEARETRGVDLGIVVPRPGAELTANIGAVETEDGTRYTLDAGASRQLSGGGSVALTLGAVRTAAEETLVAGRASYVRPLPLGQFSAALSRSVGDDADEGEVLLTAFEAGYDTQLSPVADLSLGLSVTERNVIPDGADTRTVAVTADYDQALSRVSSLSAGVAYLEEWDLDADESLTIASATIGFNRQLTRDWMFGFGVTGELREDEADGTDATSETIFISLGRSFETSF